MNHVTLLQNTGELIADTVLQERLRSLPNVTIITNALTSEITGDRTVNGIEYIDAVTKEKHHVALDGVFIQIGLLPNTEFLEGSVQLNERGEIVTDRNGATDIDGVFAAGDCANSAYKQIVISIGAGATAALSAFDYLIRHTEELVEV